MRSLKRTLIAWAVFAAVALAAAAGLSLYFAARTHLIRQFDASVLRKARFIASTIEVEVIDLELGFEDLDISEFDSPEGGGYLQVWADGDPLYRSPSLGGADLADPADAGDVVHVTAEPADIDIPVRWLELPAGRRGRGVVYRYRPANDTDPDDDLEDDVRTPPGFDAPRQVTVTLGLARDAAELTGALDALRFALVALGLALAVALAAVIAFVVSRGLRPIDRLARDVGSIDERTLDRPLELPHAPRELAPIVDQFNALLARLDAAFSRERRFSADIAHELRTPLAAIRATLDVTRARTRSVDEHERCLDQLHEVTGQMQMLVDGLLQLTRLEAGRVDARHETVDVDEHLRRAWREAQANGLASKPFNERLDLQAPDPIQTDPALLVIILRNVLHNALTYVDPGGEVELTTRIERGRVVLTVSNTGAAVDPADADKVFDRFWRADAARAQTPTGARFGLGLPLTRLAAEALGGSVSATTHVPGRFTVTVELPQTPDTRQPAT